MTSHDQKHGLPQVKSFRVTREGKWFILLLIGVGIAALNTGNNLLYLIFSLKFCLFCTQVFLGELNLKNMSLRRSAQKRTIAGESFPVTLHITSRNKRFPLFSIQVRDVIDGAPFKRSGHFLKANAKETRHIEYRCERYYRGRSLFNGILVSSAFPFGLTERTKVVPLSHELIVWPAIVPVHMPRQFTDYRSGVVPIARRGNSEDFWQLRDFHIGDDARRIYWKASARQHRLILLETAAQSNKRIEMALDLNSAKSVDEKETLIRIAASVADLLVRHRIPVTLYTSDVQTVESTSDSCTELLDHLALLDIANPRHTSLEAVPPGTLVINSANASVFVLHHGVPSKKPLASTPSISGPDDASRQGALP